MNVNPSSQAPVLVIDFGLGSAQQIARRIRQLQVYCQVSPASRAKTRVLANEAAAIVLAGGAPGDSAVSDPLLQNALQRSSVPILGLGGGLQAITGALAALPDAVPEAGLSPTGFMWRPELEPTANSQQMLESFLFQVAGLSPSWTAKTIAQWQVQAIREQVGSDRVLCGLSGGVDSAVSAALVQRAVGDQLTCVFVDTGLMRQGEREQVEQDFVQVTGAR
ncbi:MAG: GMP synthase (glutamine-hydrolyzing), partial [Micrococcales bacterium]|nr:GMP synthase (glutamine-hydrolyzing) [Micrococcales bacterium]